MPPFDPFRCPALEASIHSCKYITLMGILLSLLCLSNGIQTTVPMRFIITMELLMTQIYEECSSKRLKTVSRDSIPP